MSLKKKMTEKINKKKVKLKTFNCDNKIALKLKTLNSSTHKKIKTIQLQPSLLNKN